MLAQSGLCSVFAGAHILHHAFLTSDAVNNSLGLAIKFTLNVCDNPSGSGFHHSHFQDKEAHWTASYLFVAFVHSIQNSSFSDWGESGDSRADQLTSQISSNFVCNEGRGGEYLTQVWVRAFTSIKFSHLIPGRLLG